MKELICLAIGIVAGLTIAKKTIEKVKCHEAYSKIECKYFTLVGTIFLIFSIFAGSCIFISGIRHGNFIAILFSFFMLFFLSFFGWVAFIALLKRSERISNMYLNKSETIEFKEFYEIYLVNLWKGKIKTITYIEEGIDSKGKKRKVEVNIEAEEVLVRKENKEYLLGKEFKTCKDKMLLAREMYSIKPYSEREIESLTYGKTEEIRAFYSDGKLKSWKIKQKQQNSERITDCPVVQYSVEKQREFFKIPFIAWLIKVFKTTDAGEIERAKMIMAKVLEEKILKKYPEYALGYAKLASFIMDKDPLKAEDLLRKSMEKGPEVYDVYEVYLKFLKGRGGESEMEEILKKAKLNLKSEEYEKIITLWQGLKRR